MLDSDSNELENQIRPSWDVYFMEIAKKVATRSHDRETKIGAVVVDENNRIIATGYNGFPPGSDDDSLPKTRPEKYPYMIHAELNAIASSRQDLRNSTLYVTKSPCKECAKAIITAGVKRVVYQNVYSNDDFSFVQKLFTQAEVDLEKVIY